MSKPRTELLLELLRKNENGLSIEQLTKKFGITNKDVGNTLQLLKSRGFEILKINEKYQLSERNKKDSSIQKASRSAEVLRALTDSPNGLSAKELANMLNISSNNVFGLIHYLRSRGHLIKIKNGLYFYTDKSNNLNNVTSKIKTVLKTPSPKQEPYLIPKKYNEAFLNLTESDKADCIDMLRKSLYYYKSAISLIESNSEVYSFISSMRGDV